MSKREEHNHPDLIIEALAVAVVGLVLWILWTVVVNPLLKGVQYARNTEKS